MAKRELGSLTKEFPLADVDRTIALVRDGMTYKQLREEASNKTHIDIPALLRNRFLLVEDGVILQDRFLSMIASEDLTSPRVRKSMFLVWAMRDHRLRRFIVEVIADKHGRWRPNQITRKDNAKFFNEFFEESTTPKVRSNVEYFLHESGIFDTSTHEIHLELDDGWVSDAMRIAAQHVPDPAVARAIANDPADFLIANGLNGLVNATIDELRGLPATFDPEGEANEDAEISVSVSPPAKQKRWNRKKPTPSNRVFTSAVIELVARERASASHHELERLLASSVEAKGLEPLYNEHIDLYFQSPVGFVLAEMKSCRRNNLHAQVRKAISQLLEYRFLYKHMLGNDPTLLLVIELPPDSRQSWIGNYLDELNILLAWKSPDGSRLECSAQIPDHLSGLLFNAEA